MLRTEKGAKPPPPPQKKQQQKNTAEVGWGGGGEYGINDREIIFVWNSKPVVKAKERLRYHVGRLEGRYSHKL